MAGGAREGNEREKDVRRRGSGEVEVRGHKRVERERREWKGHDKEMGERKRGVRG